MIISLITSMSSAFLIISIFVLSQGTKPLISLTSLPYGTYLVPLKIADPQGELTQNILQVVVCDCGRGDVCQDLLPRSSSLHGAAIGILLGALLLMSCECFLKR